MKELTSDLDGGLYLIFSFCKFIINSPTEHREFVPRVRFSYALELAPT